MCGTAGQALNVLITCCEYGNQ